MNVSGLYESIDTIDATSAPRGGSLRAAKRTVARTLSAPWLVPAWAPLARERVAFITLHRFAEPDLGLFGHDRELFARGLARLRKDGYALMSVAEAARRITEGLGFPRRTVVFTMDDGYRGALEQSADLFAAYDCPLTVFLTTGFIDGTTWFWWDQIEHVCLASGRPRLSVEWEGRTIALDLGTKRAKVATLLDVCAWCKTLPDDAKWRFIDRLAQAAGVELGPTAPEAYAPLSWDEVRTFESRGVISFGPHTVTHPILPRTTDAQSAWEITESWARLRTELRAPVDVFSFPNGAYGPRELRVLEGTSLRASVTTVPAYTGTPGVALRGSARFELPRFSYPEAPDPLCLIASGFRSIEMALGRWRTRTAQPAAPLADAVAR